MKYLLLFDIDGTLLKFKQYRSKEIFSKVFYDIFKFDLSIDLIPDFSGKTDLQVLHQISDDLNIKFSEILEHINFLWEHLLFEFKKFTNADTIELIPGVPEILIELEKTEDFNFGLQTGNFKQNAYLKLDAFNLSELFPFGAFGSDHEDRNLLPPLAIKRANQYYRAEKYNNTNTLVIGDSIKDIECAKSNNLPILTVNNNCNYEELRNKFDIDLVTDNFLDTELIISNIYNLFE